MASVGKGQLVYARVRVCMCFSMLLRAPSASRMLAIKSKVPMLAVTRIVIHVHVCTYARVHLREQQPHQQ
jgi:hypothetical protein